MIALAHFRSLFAHQFAFIHSMAPLSSKRRSKLYSASGSCVSFSGNMSSIAQGLLRLCRLTCVGLIKAYRQGAGLTPTPVGRGG